MRRCGLREIGVLLAMALASAKVVAAPEAPSSDTIVLSDEELKALGGGPAATDSATTATTESAIASRPANKWSASFEPCRSFPLSQFAYWEWLESGALSPIAQIEEQITDLRREYRRTLASERWSEQLQRELDRIEDDIAALEADREQTLLEQIALLESQGADSAETRARIALFEMALALNDLDEGKARKAVEVLDRAKEHLPNEPLVRALSGVALREAGRGDAARDDLQAALATEPNLLLALVALAEVHEDNLEYDQAARLWDRAVQAPLTLPRGVERWADRNREAFPQGGESLRRAFSDRFRLRLRLARLRDFAHQYYQSFEKGGYRLLYDPSIGVPPLDDFLLPLRTVISRYMESGEEGVEPEKIERLFHDLSLERNEQDFRRFMSEITSDLATAGRDIGEALGFGRSRPPVVVLYNPNVWETLIADRWTLGLFAPHGRSISIYLTPRMTPDDLKSTVYHEYAHYVTFEIVGPRTLPLWLVEGLAEYLAAESGYDRFARDPVLARWRESWLRDPVARPWFDKDQETFDVSDYFKARRAVGVLAARFGDGGVARFLGALGNGSDLDGASREAFQMSYRDLLRYLARQLPSWTGL
jgi:tetratricopeptide (TPR) repeat protein